ncbi:MAG: hypothetical protein ACRDLV_09765 [Solirubrobacteraceae bacterium]
MLLMVVATMVAGYTLVYAGMAKGDVWRHPWQPIVDGLALNTGAGSGAARTPVVVA